jgi:hypothetical protein
MLKAIKRFIESDSIQEGWAFVEAIPGGAFTDKYFEHHVTNNKEGWPPPSGHRSEIAFGEFRLGHFLQAVNQHWNFGDASQSSQQSVSPNPFSD